MDNFYLKHLVKEKKVPCLSVSNVELKVIALTHALMLLHYVQILIDKINIPGVFKAMVKVQIKKTIVHCGHEKYGLGALICLYGPYMGYLWQRVWLSIFVNIKMSAHMA